MAIENSKKEVFKLAYPRGSFDAQLPDRMVFQPVEGDGWSLEEAEEFARAVSAKIGIDSNEFSLVNSYGKEAPLILGEDQAKS